MTPQEYSLLLYLLDALTNAPIDKIEKLFTLIYPNNYSEKFMSYYGRLYCYPRKDLNTLIKIIRMEIC